MIENFINTVSNGDTSTMDTSFKNLIMTKVNTVLDIKRIELTSDIFNKQKNVVAESADDAYKSTYEQEQSNPRFVEAHKIIHAGLTPEQMQIHNELLANWNVNGGNIQKIMRNFYQKVYTSGNNPANPRMQKALAYVLDKLQ
jgi:hypothetical protein